MWITVCSALRLLWHLLILDLVRQQVMLKWIIALSDTLAALAAFNDNIVLCFFILFRLRCYVPVRQRLLDVR